MCENIFSNEMIGERLIKAREDKGYTQDDVASALGVKRELVSFWEHGKRELKAGYLIEIAKFLDVSTDYLLGVSENKSLDPKLQNAAAYLGVSEKAVKGIKESIDVINTQISEEENSEITRSVIDTVFSSDKRFLSTLVMIVAEMRGRKDIDVYCSAPALKEGHKVYLTDGIYDDEYNNFKNCKIILEYLEHFANSCESNFSKDDIKRIMAAETTKDLLLQMETYKTPKINGKIWRTFANRFINENKDDEQIKSMFK